MTRFSLLPFCLFSLLLALAAPAQNSDAKPALVRFVAQQVPTDMPRVVMRTEDKISDPFELPVNNLTPKLKSPARTFHLTLENRNISIGSVKLPEEGESFVILLLLAKKDGYHPIVLPAAANSFRPGDIYLHNHSDQAILGKIGDKSFTIPPGKGLIHHPSGAVAKTYYSVAFAIRGKTGKDRFLTTSRWPVNHRNRSYVIFHNDPSTGRVKFRAIDEFIAPVQQ